MNYLQYQLKIDVQKVRERLVNFTKNAVKKTGFKKAVVGLSGGIDSSLVAYILAEALGSQNVYGIYMPYADNTNRYAELVAQTLHIHFKEINIYSMINTYFILVPTDDVLRKGNKMARERMSILYDFAKLFDAVVIGTSNKTEILLGYGTIFGDLAWLINPIGDLYKTFVKQMAVEYNIPDMIINRKPSAELWEGQFDEDELGFTYEDVDKLLFLMFERHYSIKELLQIGFAKDFIDNVLSLIRKNKFKRSQPLICRFSNYYNYLSILKQ